MHGCIWDDIAAMGKHDSIHDVRQLTRQEKVIGKDTKRSEDAIHHEIGEHHNDKEREKATSIQRETHHEIRKDFK